MSAHGDSDRDLHAYIDGALDDAGRQALEDRLAADPALAARLAGFAADKTRLKQIYAPLDSRPIPEAWLALARAPQPRPRRLWPAVAALAAVLVVLLAGVAVYQRAEPPASREIVAAALAARGTPAAEQTIAVADAGDLRRYDDALRQAVALPVKVPDMRRMGYQLAGMRTYAGHAAEIAYRDAGGRLFTLYVRHSDGSVRFDQFERAGLRVCIWQDDRLGMVMAGNVSTAAMQRLASLAYTGLTT